jgi:hypothetical protein
MVLAGTSLLIPHAAQAASSVILEPPAAPVGPGTTFSFFIRLNGSTALMAYDLDVRIDPEPGALGSVMADVAQTNLYPAQNLIEQGGNGLHPAFSTVESLLPDNPGVSVAGLDNSFQALAVPGPGQDVLAQIFMTASADAFGEFKISLADSSELIINGTELEDFDPALITVQVPEPSTIALLAGFAMAGWGRRRRRC